MPPRPTRRAPAPVAKPAAPVEGTDEFKPLEMPPDDEHASTASAAPVSEDAETGMQFAPPPARPAAEAPAQAGGRSAGTSSRRGKAVSSRRAAAVDTPEARAERAQERRAGFRLALVLLACAAGVGLLGFAFWAVALREDPRVPKAQAELAAAQAALESCRSALSNHDAKAAAAAYEEAVRVLAGSPGLGFAKQNPDRTPEMVPTLAARAWELRQEVDACKPKIDAAQRGLRADANVRSLRGRFEKLTDEASDLDALRRDAESFIANPVEPAAGPNPEYVKEFGALVGDIQVRMASIQQEVERRRVLRQQVPVAKARLVAEGLVKQERFQEALDKVAAIAKDSPDADLASVRQYISDAAEAAMKSVRKYAETCAADLAAPGTTDIQRNSSREGARRRLGEVIERFGIPALVGEAQTLRKKFE